MERGAPKGILASIYTGSTVQEGFKGEESESENQFSRRTAWDRPRAP